MSAEVHVVSHPLALHEMTRLRQKSPSTSTSSLRRLTHEISMLMAHEVPCDRPERGDIVPGLGDAGDGLFGTKQLRGQGVPIERPAA